MAGYIGSQTPVVSNGSQRKYTFTATAAQTVFTGMDIPNPQQIQVFQNGVRLVITTDYTVSSGTTVTLVNAASAGDSLVVILFADYQLLDTDALTFTGGTTIEGDLTVDTNTLYVDSTNNRVGIGTSSVPAAARAMVSGGRFYVNSQDQYSVLLQNGGTSGGFIGTTGGDTINFFNSGGTERLRILSSGGITFNGDTATANALDDYEEGTWTPVLSANYTGTYQSQVGTYTKVGNLVSFSFYLETATASGAGNITLAGLPFAAGAGSNRYHAYQGFTNAWTSNGNVQCLLGAGATYLNMYDIPTSGGVTTTTVAHIGSGGNIIISGTYTTDA